MLPLQEENAKLRREVSALQSAMKDKDTAVSQAESRLASVEAQSKIALAETQVGVERKE